MRTAKQIMRVAINLQTSKAKLSQWGNTIAGYITFEVPGEIEADTGKDSFSTQHDILWV